MINNCDICRSAQVIKYVTYQIYSFKDRVHGYFRGYYSEYGNIWFSKRENDDAYYTFRTCNNCYYSSSEPVTDQEDEF